jgi:REP element-mobilizing transposase RayT
MCKPRKTLINLKNTEYYHCISRCVRRAFLCGDDKLSQKNFEHRRQWIVDRMKLLTENFTIGICAYAILSNHFHLVLKVNKKQSLKMNNKQVAACWTAIYPSGKAIVKTYLEGTATDKQVKVAKRKIKVWRKRLRSISWFMRSLNHYIACKANKEDSRKGHFWEARFTSQALLDDTARLSCMVYVDLNPIRAGMSNDLNSSEFTSIQERIQALKLAQEVVETSEADDDNKAETDSDTQVDSYQPNWLLAFGDSNSQTKICFSLVEYIDMVDWTGRQVRSDKKGYIGADVPAILTQLDISATRWLELSQRFERIFAGFAAKAEKLYFYANKMEQSCCKGVSA